MLSPHNISLIISVDEFFYGKNRICSLKYLGVNNNDNLLYCNKFSFDVSLFLPVIDITRYITILMTTCQTDDSIIQYGPLCSFYCVE